MEHCAIEGWNKEFVRPLPSLTSLRLTYKTFPHQSSLNKTSPSQKAEDFRTFITDSTLKYEWGMTLSTGRFLAISLVWATSLIAQFVQRSASTDVPLHRKEFGNQIDLCRDRGLSPGSPAQKSDTLPLDHQFTLKQVCILTLRHGDRPIADTSYEHLALPSSDTLQVTCPFPRPCASGKRCDLSLVYFPHPGETFRRSELVEELCWFLQEFDDVDER
uniref:Uncharacterized protein n=1 Tax=Timema genevievae TaxID=629358 RepID=A0A7R9K7L3_TIMGE|nr:unnamed protein product [Timema genevievae]